jgi:hypothetical protein
MKMNRNWNRVVSLFVRPRRQPAARLWVEPLESRYAPAGLSLWWNPNNAVYVGSDPRNYYDATDNQQCTETSFQTSDVINFGKCPNPLGGDPLNPYYYSHVQFNNDIHVDHVNVDSTWGSQGMDVGYAGHGVNVSTDGPSFYTDGSATITLHGGSTLFMTGTQTTGTALTAGYFTSDGAAGNNLGIIGGVVLNPPSGTSVTLNCTALVHTISGILDYTTAGGLKLNASGRIQVYGNGTFLAQPDPPPLQGFDQTVTCSAGSTVEVKDGYFLVKNGGQKLTFTAGLGSFKLTNAAGVLQVYDGTTLAVPTGILENAGTINLEGGTSATATTIDVGANTVDVYGNLNTVNNTRTDYWAQISGSLTVEAGGTLTIGKGLDGSGFATSLGPQLIVTANATINGTFADSVYNNGAGALVPWVCSTLDCALVVHFGSGATCSVESLGWLKASNHVP